ncbi:MAG: J domain-containing protein [Arenicellales bacterium]
MVSASNISPKWILALSTDVQQGHFSNGLTEARFNDVLKWLLERDFIIGQQLSAVFNNVYETETKARENVFLALDDYLFVFSNESPYAVLGLRENVSQDVAKIRYRRLIQLYHPDRSLAQALGLAHRAEKLNLAFDRIKSGNISGSSVSQAYAGGSTTQAPQSTSNYSYNTQYRARASDKARAAMGSPQKVKWSLLSALALGSVAALLMVYSNNRPIEYEGLQLGGSDFNVAAESEVDKMNVMDSASLELEPIVMLEALSMQTQERNNVLPIEAKTLVAGETLPVVKNTTSKIIASKIEKENLIVLDSISEPSEKDENRMVDFTAQKVAKFTPNSAKLDFELSSARDKPLLAKKPINKPKPVKKSIQKTPPRKTALNQTLDQKARDKPKLPTKVSQKEALKVDQITVALSKARKKVEVISQPVIIPPIVAKAVPVLKSQKLSKSDQKRALKVLKNYVNGMLIGDTKQTLNHVDDVVSIDGKLTPKSQLRLTYNDWLNSSISRKYKFKVKEMKAFNGFVRISGNANIGFKYPLKSSKSYKGDLYFDIKPERLGGKIIAIQRL